MDVPSTPSPGTDPSTLATQQVWREIASLKELILIHINRIDAAVQLAHEDLVRVPTDVQKAVGALKELHEQKFATFRKDLENLEKFFLSELAGEHNLKEEKFNKVEQRFQLLETQRAEQKQDTKLAVDAAFAASKEAVREQNNANTVAISKSEATTQKQIDQIEQLSTSGRNALAEQIADIKDRLTRMEGNSSGKKDFWGYIIGGIGLIGGLLAIFYSLSQHVIK